MTAKEERYFRRTAFIVAVSASGLFLGYGFLLMFLSPQIFMLSIFVILGGELAVIFLFLYGLMKDHEEYERRIDHLSRDK